MSIENNPEPIENAMDIFAKAGYVKAENDKISISFDSANTLNPNLDGNMIFNGKRKLRNSRLCNICWATCTSISWFSQS